MNGMNVEELAKFHVGNCRFDEKKIIIHSLDVGCF
jgi:hypothetical protein